MAENRKFAPKRKYRVGPQPPRATIQPSQGVNDVPIASSSGGGSRPLAPFGSKTRFGPIARPGPIARSGPNSRTSSGVGPGSRFGPIARPGSGSGSIYGPIARPISRVGYGGIGRRSLFVGAPTGLEPGNSIVRYGPYGETLNCPMCNVRGSRNNQSEDMTMNWQESNLDAGPNVISLSDSPPMSGSMVAVEHLQVAIASLEIQPRRRPRHRRNSSKVHPGNPFDESRPATK